MKIYLLKLYLKSQLFFFKSAIQYKVPYEELRRFFSHNILYTNTHFACIHFHVGGLLFKHPLNMPKSHCSPNVFFPFYEYICIIDVFIYFGNTASMVKGGIYVLPWHTEQHPNESHSSLALKHLIITMTVPGIWWIKFLLHVEGCTANHVSHHSGELEIRGFYALTTSLSLYIVSSEC